MRKVVLVVLLALVSVEIFAQSGAGYYVSAMGNDNNNGLSERTTFRSLRAALNKAQTGTIKKITVIGTLNEETEGMGYLTKERMSAVFGIFNTSGSTSNPEILITGKSDAAGSERAVLSAVGSGADVLYCIGGIKVRFEHIEISGAERTNGVGIQLADGSQVNLGPGAVIRANQGLSAIYVGKNSSILLNGGVIRENKNAVKVAEGASFTMINGTIQNNETSHGGGVVVLGTFTMSGGVIMDNLATMAGGGVWVAKNGKFIMTGGSITGNRGGGELVRDTQGGGVFVSTGGTFDQTGGIVTGNTADSGPNVYREVGSLGSNLLSPSPSPSSTPASSSGSPSPAPGAPPADEPPDIMALAFYAGYYITGWRQNTFSFGVPLQMGMDFNYGGVTLDLLCEIGIGMGFPLLFEFNAGSMGELYFSTNGYKSRFGIGVGYGLYRNFNNWTEGEAPEWIIFEPVKVNYLRMGFLHRSGSRKISLYAHRYSNGNWGGGFQLGMVLNYAGRR